MFSNHQSLFQFRGPLSVPVQLCPSLILLVLVFVDFGAPQGVVFDLVFLFLMLSSIFLHEIGHAWGCHLQNIPVDRVVLFAGGGYCEHSNATTHHQEELIVALGPIVNLTIWAVSSLLVPLAHSPEMIWVLATLSWVNLWLALFNLLPIQPLDGGKLFYLILGRVMPFHAAMRIAGGVGLLAVVALIPALLYSWWAFGFVLFFLPSLPTHWDMLTGKAG